MAKMTVENEVFKLPIDIVSDGITKKVLQTADTYVDKNIEIAVNVPDATFEIADEGSVTATVSVQENPYVSDTETAYAVQIMADAIASDISVKVKDAGFAAETDTITVTGTSAQQDSKTIYIKEGQLSGTGSAGAEGNIELTKVGAQPESGFFIKASGAGNVGVSVAGWVDPAKTTGVTTDGDAFYKIQEATLSNTGSATAVELDRPILVEDGFLFINEGYIQDSKISLATLVPNDAVIPNVVEGKSDLMYKTVAAYDSDGKLIAGTMDDATLGGIVAENASANIATVTVEADEVGFKVTGSGDISGTASVNVTKQGLAKTTLSSSGAIEGTASVEATIAKIGLGVTADSDVEVTPIINKEDSTTAKTGVITTSQPIGRYIAVSTAAIAKSASVDPKVISEGYGTVDTFSSTGTTIKAGAAASGTYYIPVLAGSHEAIADTPTIVDASATVSSEVNATEGFTGDLVAGVLTVAPTSGEYITITADASTVKGSVSGVVTCTATEGYIEADSRTASISEDVSVAVTAAAPKYIKVYDGAIL